MRSLKLIFALVFLLSAFSFTGLKKIGKGGSELDIYHPDYDHLNELVLAKINEKRQKKSETVLERNEALQQTALYFTRDLKLSKFEKLKNDRKVLQKKVHLISWKKGYNNNLLNVIVTLNEAVNYKGGKFYIDKKDTETNSHLFYGDKPTKKETEEPGYVSKPIKDFSYEELAEKIANKFLQDKRTFKCLNSGYDLVGCSCSIDAKTLNRTKIPIIKAIIILGGKRINF